MRETSCNRNGFSALEPGLGVSTGAYHHISLTNGG